MMTLGLGAIISFSQKQKINSKSLTESELVGVDDALPQILWNRYFMESQGYNEDNILFQDNKSAILLKKNGKTSSTKRTKHIKVSYFFTGQNRSRQSKP